MKGDNLWENLGHIKRTSNIIIIFFEKTLNNVISAGKEDISRKNVGLRTKEKTETLIFNETKQDYFKRKNNNINVYNLYNNKFINKNNRNISNNDNSDILPIHSHIYIK